MFTLLAMAHVSTRARKASLFPLPLDDRDQTDPSRCACMHAWDLVSLLHSHWSFLSNLCDLPTFESEAYEPIERNGPIPHIRLAAESILVLVAQSKRVDSKWNIACMHAPLEGLDGMFQAAAVQVPDASCQSLATGRHHDISLPREKERCWIRSKSISLVCSSSHALQAATQKFVQRPTNSCYLSSCD
jgi:hypothetical protein